MLSQRMTTSETQRTTHLHEFPSWETGPRPCQQCSRPKASLGKASCCTRLGLIRIMWMVTGSRDICIVMAFRIATIVLSAPSFVVLVNIRPAMAHVCRWSCSSCPKCPVASSVCICLMCAWPIAGCDCPCYLLSLQPVVVSLSSFFGFLSVCRRQTERRPKKDNNETTTGCRESK